MDVIGKYFTMLVEGMSYKINIYGYSFSMKDVFIWSALGGTFATLLWGFIKKE